jgi:uncharacterized protein YqeY
MYAARRVLLHTSVDAFKQKLKQDMKTYMQTKNKPKLNVVKSLMNEILVKEKNGDRVIVNDVLHQQIKKRRLSIEEFKSANRPDLVEIESNEILDLESYLPPQTDPAELRKILTEIRDEFGLTKRDLGALLKSAEERGVTASKQLIVSEAKKILQ